MPADRWYWEKVVNTLPLRKFALIVAVLLMAIGMFVRPLMVQAQQDDLRKLRKSVAAAYPELARKNNIHGIVRLQIVITPDGRVKETKPLGGNPVLVDAFTQAVLKWEYEPAGHSSTIVVMGEFK